MLYPPNPTSLAAKSSKSQSTQLLNLPPSEETVDAESSQFRDPDSAARVVQQILTVRLANSPAAVSWLCALLASKSPEKQQQVQVTADSTSASASTGSSSDPVGACFLSTPALASWVSALSLCVSSLSLPRAAPVVEAILRMDRWYSSEDGSDTLTIEYKHLLENLVSAHGFFVQSVVASIVKALRKARTGKESQAALVSKYDRIHSVLSAVIRLIPSSLNFMPSLLSENFPHKSSDTQDNVWYLKNLMRILEYAPILRNPVWALAIDKVVQIDVEIQTALDDLGEDDFNQVLAHCFDIDSSAQDKESLSFLSPKTFAAAGRAGIIPLNDELRLDEDEPVSDDDDDSSEEDTDDDEDDDDDSPPPVVVSDFREMTGKLDSMLHFLMGQISATFKSTEGLESNKSDGDAFEFFCVLLELFERIILPTHQCKYVQFLYFYACSMSPKCSESFLVLLAQKTFDTTCPIIIRVASSAYLSSFVARAKFVETESVLYCLRMLNGWALKYTEENEFTIKSAAGVDTADFAKVHACFYAVVQALLYIFCFRWREIVAAAAAATVAGPNLASGVEYGRLPVEMTGFERIVQSKFSPLKVRVREDFRFCLTRIKQQVCTKSVVAEFARITHKLDILYCYAHMQQTRPTKRQQAVQSQQTPQVQLLAPPVAQQPGRQAVPDNDENGGPTMAMSYQLESPFLAAVRASATKTPAEFTSTSVPAAPAVADSMANVATLEPFFPFDPCHLVMSKILVESVYREWEDDDDDGDGDDDDDGDEHYGYNTGGRLAESELEFISGSFENHMSI
ncbi:hypothetical protein HDU83_009535 [Entophlyctis luteolus]|nr:hypothetical protein HDU82_001245 [Entophlyctis luteolus]KAJ3350602.1 hypothetical protein HDU83_009535 [Entophlyctis luteolus]KAJ3389916.1 hypothetical protein HDU84_008162 [Entophlyctis sp. JEL0112]